MSVTFPACRWPSGGAIYGAPAVRDAPSAQAAALTHVSTTESWFRLVLDSERLQR
jgi:hypothetical protein